MTTETLHQYLLAEPDTRNDLVDALATIIGEEIRNGRGLSGATLRSAVATLNRMKPGFVRRAVNKLLPEWIDVLQKHYAVYQLARAARPCETFGDFLVARKGVVADELLAATSQRAEKSGNRLARTLFRRIEGNAQENIAAAVPRLAAVVDGALRRA